MHDRLSLPTRLSSDNPADPDSRAKLTRHSPEKISHLTAVNRHRTTQYFYGDKSLFAHRSGIFPEDLNIFPEDKISFPEDLDIFPEDKMSVPQDLKILPDDKESFSEDKHIFPEDIISLPQGCDIFPADKMALPEDKSIFPLDQGLFPEDQNLFPDVLKAFPTGQPKLPLLTLSPQAPRAPETIDFIHARLPSLDFPTKSLSITLRFTTFPQLWNRSAAQPSPIVRRRLYTPVQMPHCTLRSLSLGS